MKIHWINNQKEPWLLDHTALKPRGGNQTAGSSQHCHRGFLTPPALLLLGPPEISLCSCGGLERFSEFLIFFYLPPKPISQQQNFKFVNQNH